MLAPGGAEGNSGNFNAVACSSASYCVAVGGDGTFQGVAGLSSAGGTSWVAGTVASGLPDLEALSCSTVLKCVAVGQGATVVTIDGGQTWTAHAIPSPDTTLLGVSCYNSTHCVAVGVSPGDNGPYNGDVLVTSDGGTTWTVPTVPSGSGALGSVACASATLCVAVGASVLVSTNGGGTWSARSVAGGTGVLRSVSCSASTCVAIGANPLATQDPSAMAYAIVTQDAGATWSQATMPPGSGNLFALSCVTALKCVAAGSSTSGGPAIVVSSNDGGATWSVNASFKLSVDAVSAISCSSATACLFLGRAGQSAVAVASSNGVATTSSSVTSLVRAQEVRS